MKPTFGGQALRVQDMMIMRIINDAAWRVPIYFAVTVSQQNRIGLDNFLDMQGLTFQLKSHRTSPVDTEKMYENLMMDVGPKEWSTNFDEDNFYLSMTELLQPETDEEIIQEKEAESSVGIGKKRSVHAMWTHDASRVHVHEQNAHRRKKDSKRGEILSRLRR